jgi:hypothetical protein
MKSSLQFTRHLHAICKILVHKSIFLNDLMQNFEQIPLATISLFPPKGQDYDVIIIFKYQCIEINSLKQFKAFIPIV